MKLTGFLDTNQTTLIHLWFPQNAIALAQVILFLLPPPPLPLWTSKSTVQKVQLICFTLKSPLFSPLGINSPSFESISFPFYGIH